MAQPHPVEMMITTIAKDNVSPPTKAQVLYWRELCQVVAAVGPGGIRDQSWPPEITPLKLTLKTMVEHQLLVRRLRAWHLRRHWQETLDRLTTISVPTPPLRLLDRPAPSLPTFTELEAWEQVCLWLDMQPRHRARLPFGISVTGDLLKEMRRFRVVRHTGECHWVLSPTWKARLLALWQGIVKSDGEHMSEVDTNPFPVSVASWHKPALDLPVSGGFHPKLPS